MKCSVIILLIFMLALPAAQADTELPAEVLSELAAAEIPLEAVGIVVQAAGEEAPSISINATQAMNPASVMKLVTTWAALETLGPAHTWTTTAYLRGTLSQGTLDGDLVLKGSGDPKLTLEQFWLLLRDLRARGLSDIGGDLVLDRTAFAPLVQDTAFDDQPLRAYNVIPDALLLNFKAVRLTFIPGQDGKIAILKEPPLANLDIVNLMQASSEPCGEWKDGIAASQFPILGRYQLTLTGRYPATCGEQDWPLGVLSHPDYIAATFRTLWQELGGTLSGNVRDGSAPAGAASFASIESPTLAEIVRDINKHSNNVMARQLFLSLARDVPATTPDAAAAVRDWLAGRGIDTEGLVLDNGSGLSRQERMSAHALVQLLQAAAASPLMPEFVASLPLGAVDGTMRKRLNGEAVAGHAHIKTGSLDGVRSMAGYVQDARGREVIVVFLVNHANAQRARAAQDALLKLVFRAESQPATPAPQ
jgi:D-alanyl-D-alanine carboxypeptidase/D-alanyl-D-alanine-endopeptidase (penicillin-binding protein 4)